MTWPPRPLLLLLLLFVSCSTEIDTPGEQLRIFGDTLDEAFVGESYGDNIEVIGGLSPYRFELRSGTLPPGLELQGATLRGTPTEEGSYTFTVNVSDANLSRTFEEYTVEVSVPPPARLELSVPETEMSDPFTVPVTLRDARNLQAFRTLLTWDASRFELVEGSVRATRGRVLLLQEAEEGELNVDAAFLGDALSGDARVFTFDLRPLEPSTIEVTARTEFRGVDGAHAFAETTGGIAPDTFDEDDDVTGGAGDVGDDFNNGEDETGDDNGDNGEDD